MNEPITHIIVLRQESPLNALFAHRTKERALGLETALLRCSALQADMTGFVRCHVSWSDLPGSRPYLLPTSEILLIADVSGRDPRTIGFLRE